MYVYILLYLDEVDDMRRQLKQDRDGLIISKFCKPRLYSREAAMSYGKYSPTITWFKLSSAACNMLHLLYKWKESVVFRKIWSTQLRQISSKGTKLTVVQIEQSIWQQSNEIWKAFCRGMVGILLSATSVKQNSSQSICEL